jgi:hypothetical protein
VDSTPSEHLEWSIPCRYHIPCTRLDWWKSGGMKAATCVLMAI